MGVLLLLRLYIFSNEVKWQQEFTVSAQCSFVLWHKSEVFSWRQLHNHPHSTWQLLVPLKPLGVECGRCSTVQTSSPKTRRSSVSFHKAAVGRHEERTSRLRHDCRLVTNSGCWTSLLFMRTLFHFWSFLSIWVQYEQSALIWVLSSCVIGVSSTLK